MQIQDGLRGAGGFGIADLAAAGVGHAGSCESEKDHLL